MHSTSNWGSVRSYQLFSESIPVGVPDKPQSGDAHMGTPKPVVTASPVNYTVRVANNSALASMFCYYAWEDAQHCLANVGFPLLYRAISIRDSHL